MKKVLIYRHFKNFAEKLLSGLRLEAKDTKEMFITFSEHLAVKLKIKERNDLPTEEEYKNALIQLKNIPKILPIVSILIFFPIPFSAIGYVMLIRFLQKFFKTKVNLLPDKLQKTLDSEEES